ncbi:EboA domain-containing protein [Nocardioides sp. zg-1228]|uniref:EboA domain-containing protein n=1 Tax=Nocardioides sp. zg-1228 TaxID=2763008 RepID=UPI0016428DBA|nr:EboA domain-containing protein [Nocardioides sp. zg-1228]MBC2932630.1 EboA domain-containing protein [Nocardioides sp. zg-1228]QSF58117.1 EboA domain-containing protein [Nocardioides sp. zg-1228]
MTDIRPLADHDAIRSALDDAARARWEAMNAEVAEDPSRLGRTFPAAARTTGRGPLPGADGVLLEDAVRVRLVVEAARSLDAAALLAELGEVYRYGDNDEKRAVLHALAGAPDEVDGTDLLLDALRTNDTRLVAAAMGPHSDRLDDDAWRQGVLKCLFTGVPVASVTGLSRRADRELAEMVQRYQREREAAGRDVPPDVQVVLDACGASPEKQPEKQKDS